MNDIEEKTTTVTIEEEEEETEDIVIELNTGEVGISTFTTDVIKGEVEAIIINTTNRVEIDITSELGYKLFSVRDFPMDGSSFTDYIALRTQCVDEKGHRIGYSYDEFNLNERLSITVQGTKNTTVKFIFRMEE